MLSSSAVVTESKKMIEWPLIGDLLLRRRVKRELLARGREALLDKIDRDLADRQSKVDEIKRSSVGFGHGSGLILLEELYGEIRWLRRYLAVVQKMAERPPFDRTGSTT